MVDSGDNLIDFMMGMQMSSVDNYDVQKNRFLSDAEIISNEVNPILRAIEYDDYITPKLDDFLKFDRLPDDNLFKNLATTLKEIDELENSSQIQGDFILKANLLTTASRYLILDTRFNSENSDLNKVEMVGYYKLALNYRKQVKFANDNLDKNNKLIMSWLVYMDYYFTNDLYTSKKPIFLNKKSEKLIKEIISTPLKTLLGEYLY